MTVRSSVASWLSGRSLIVVLVVVSAAPAARALEFTGSDKSSVSSIAWEVAVDGEIVDAELSLTFTSTSSVASGGELRFPLPTDAVLRGAEIWRDEGARFEAGETMGRRLGEAVHREESPLSATEPLLVQEVGRDAYRAVVSPIVVDKPLSLRMRYAHLLEGTSDARVLRIALGNADVRAPQVEDVVVHVRLTPGAFASATLARAPEGASFVFDEESGVGTVELSGSPLVDDVEIALVPTAARDVSSAGYRSEQEGVPPHLLVRAAPPIAAMPGTKSEPRAVVFVLDMSGSMSGQRIVEAKRALRALIAALAPVDRYSVVTFSDFATTHAPSLVSAGDVDERARITADVDARFDAGSTHVEAGLRAAAAIFRASGSLPASADILLISDGMPTLGTTTASGLVDVLESESTSVDADVRLFALGIGYDLDQTFLNAITSPFDGEATFALEDGEIVGQSLLLFESIQSGGLRSPSLSLAIDDEVAATLLTRTLFDDAIVRIGVALDEEPTVSTSIALRLDGESMSGAQTWSAAVDPPVFSSSGIALAVPALAAKVRTDALARRMEREGESEALLTEALFVAKHYGIVTRYSSYVVLSDDARYEAQGIARVPRDPAGIALVEVDTSEASEEARIGGEGGTYYGGGYTSSGGGGCACVDEPRTRLVGVIGALALVALLLPRRRRAPGARA